MRMRELRIWKSPRGDRGVHARRPRACRCRAHATTLLVLGLLAPVGIAAQEKPATGSGPFARLVVIRPKPGQDHDFEAGYQRHLTWHREHRDPWAWYGWSFVLGERLGMFMDGTFAHSASELDHPIDPAGDGTDNQRNVVPSADFVRHAVYQRIGGAVNQLPDTTAFLALTTFWIRPGDERRFEAAIARDGGVAAAAPSAIWFRLVIGGEGSEYLLFRPTTSWEAAITLPDPLAADPSAAASVLRTRAELLRYRPTMSYHP